METGALGGDRPSVREDWIPFLSVFQHFPVPREELLSGDDFENNAAEAENISSTVALIFQDFRSPVARCPARETGRNQTFRCCYRCRPEIG